MGLFLKYQWDLVAPLAKLFSKWKEECSANCSGTERAHFKMCTVIKVCVFAFSHQNMTIGHILFVLYLMVIHYTPSNFPI